MFSLFNTLTALSECEDFCPGFLPEIILHLELEPPPKHLTKEEWERSKKYFIETLAENYGEEKVHRARTLLRGSNYLLESVDGRSNFLISFDRSLPPGERYEIEIRLR
jgi:hypothetical protein